MNNCLTLKMTFKSKTNHSPPRLKFSLSHTMNIDKFTTQTLITLIPVGFSYQCREKHLNDVCWNKFPEYACDAADTVNCSGPYCGAWVF